MLRAEGKIELAMTRGLFELVGCCGSELDIGDVYRIA
jgi:hypothetical protein